MAFSTYADTLHYLYAQLPMFTRVGASAYKKDLHNTLALCNALHNPEYTFKSVHIGGTNGKGSSSHMLAAILQTAGYKTGLYTSPHLTDFRERIRINGQMIPEQEVIAFVNNHQNLFLFYHIYLLLIIMNVPPENHYRFFVIIVLFHSLYFC